MKQILAALALLAALLPVAWLSIQPCTKGAPRLAIGKVILLGGCRW